MSVKLKPTSNIKIELGIDPDGHIQSFFTNTCYKHMDKFVPKDIGNLRKNVTLRTDSITYESPYARYQYYGVREDGTNKVTHYTTPETFPYWDEKMISVYHDEILQEVQREINRRSK